MKIVLEENEIYKAVNEFCRKRGFVPKMLGQEPNQYPLIAVETVNGARPTITVHIEGINPDSFKGL